MNNPVIKKLIYGATLAVMGLLVPAAAFAQEAGGHAAATGGKNQTIALAVALAISLAAAGCGIGQGMASASAFQGMARNPGVQPKIFTSMILGLAFIESLVIYALLIAFMLLGKV